MNKDQKLLEEAYCKIYESIKEPLYFGPKNQKDLWFRWLAEHNYEVNGDGSVDINESVRLKKDNQTIISRYGSLFPIKVLPFKFRNVNGGFDVCANNLDSLVNSPIFVDGDFKVASNTNIKSLEGCPKVIYGDANFNYCSELKSLKGGPEIVKGDFECFYTEVTSLEGAPEEIGGKFKHNYLNDEIYRAHAKQYNKQKIIDRDLHKDFNVDLGDFS